MRQSFLASSLITLVACGLVGCAKNTIPNPDRVPMEPRTSTGPDRSSDVLNATELSDPAVASGDALAAVRRLRPRFLASRGAVSIRRSSAGTTTVSVNGGPLQSLSILSNMRASEILEIRFLSGPQAATRFGTTAGTGAVLLVSTR